ncbi:MAG: hypothetical protein CSB33_04255 [Desulfobacterales bacterium]|nr:MAG: hypothetical protein CSB33_04255 [Desulfobacterales bacterium]
MILTGLENLLQSPPPRLSGKRLGLLCNPASVDRSFRHARVGIQDRFPGRLTTLFSPQHGFYAEKQDNMIESDHMADPVTGCPVHSLYHAARRPTAEMMADLDVLLVDLPDMGTRVYTFMYTLSYCMETAAAEGKTVMVLDRPNPVGGRIVEGGLLEPEWASFVGRFPIPMRHGLTMGELALLFNDTFGIGCDLDVIPMAGWRREMVFADTGLPWVPPSPNLPAPDSALVYPGQVIWEGTELSEGRGTTRPFEIFGAPWLKPEAVLKEMGGAEQEGAFLRSLVFEPVSGKWAGHACRGFQIHVTGPRRLKSYDLSLRLLDAVYHLHPDFRWKSPPYEYEYERMPIDLICGTDAVRNALARGESSAELERGRSIDSGWSMADAGRLYAG